MESQENYIELIFVYVEEKIKMGYEPVFSLKEIIEFLKYFYRITEPTLNNQFINRKFVSNILSKLKEYFKRGDCDVIYPTYALDLRVRENDAWKTLQAHQFLEKFAKREVNPHTYSEDQYLIGQNVAASFLPSIWDGYIASNLYDNDLLAYGYTLVDMLQSDVSGDLEPLKSKMIEFFRTASERIAFLCYRDHKLRLNSKSEYLYAHANYLAVIRDYEELFSYAKNDFGVINHSFDYARGVVGEEKNVPVWSETDTGLILTPHLLIRENPMINKRSRELVQILGKGEEKQ